MKTFKQMLVLLIIIVLTAGHEKERKKIEEGTYTGKFKVVYPTNTRTGKTTIEFLNSRYTCTGNANSIPAGGSGTYSISKDKITFKDENIWTSDFDWNLILNGQYNYSFDGENLKISADKNGVGHYEYNLKKTKSNN